MSKTKLFNASLTEDEIKALEYISKDFFGKSNKSGMIRYWINSNRLDKAEVRGQKK